MNNNIFLVYLVLVTICFIYHIHKVYDLRKTRIYTSNTLLENL